MLYVTLAMSIYRNPIVRKGMAVLSPPTDDRIGSTFFATACAERPVLCGYLYAGRGPATVAELDQNAGLPSSSPNP